jgi:hypothetical protein
MATEYARLRIARRVNVPAIAKDHVVGRVPKLRRVTAIVPIYIEYSSLIDEIQC